MIISVKKIYEKLMDKKELNKTTLIGIDGCGGAGKSTLAEAFKSVNPERVTIIHMDDFYKPSKQRNYVKENEIGGNWDYKRVKEQLIIPLSQNQNTNYQRYDWDEDSMAEWYKVPSGGMVVIEGCYSLIKELEGYYDFKIWVESPRKVRLSRGIKRDSEEKRHLWEDLWMPAEEYYISKQNPMRKADLIIDGTGKRSDIANLEIDILEFNKPLF